MEVRIASALVGRLRDLAAASSDREVCGMLLGRDGSRIDTIRPAANVARMPEIAFEADPQTLFSAVRDEREGGPRVLGHYHSHPGGGAIPSPRDATASAGDGALWLILARGEMRMWRAVAGGSIEGAFEPVRLVED